MNPYEVLGLKEGATQKDIRLAFKILSQKHHPDKNHVDNSKYSEIREAYEILKAVKPKDPEEILNEGGMSILGQALQRCILHQGDIIFMAKGLIKQELEKLFEAKETIKAQQDILKHNKSCLKHPDKEDNFILNFINSQIETSEQSGKQVQESIDFHGRALKMLKEYSFDDMRVTEIDDLADALSYATSSSFSAFFRK